MPSLAFVRVYFQSVCCCYAMEEKYFFTDLRCGFVRVTDRTITSFYKCNSNATCYCDAGDNVQP